MLFTHTRFYIWDYIRHKMTCSLIDNRRKRLLDLFKFNHFLLSYLTIRNIFKEQPVLHFGLLVTE